MILRSRVSGTYTREQLGILRWPVAWSGAPDREQEADRAALLVEALEIFDMWPAVVAVEIEAGEIVATIVE